MNRNLLAEVRGGTAVDLGNRSQPQATGGGSGPAKRTPWQPRGTKKPLPASDAEADGRGDFPTRSSSTAASTGQATKDKLYDRVFKQAELSGKQTGSEVSDGVESLAQVVRDPLAEVRGSVNSSLRRSLQTAHEGSLASLESEFDAARRLLKGGGDTDLMLATVTTKLASVIEEFARTTLQAVDAANAQVERGHGRAVQVRSAAALVTGHNAALHRAPAQHTPPRHGCRRLLPSLST